MSENGHSFPNNYQNNNDKNNDNNGNKKRNSTDNSSASSNKYLKREIGFRMVQRGFSSPSPEIVILEDPRILAGDEERQILTRAQVRSEANNENDKVESLSDQLEKKETSARILRLLKKYRDEFGYEKEPYSILDSNNKIWFKAADITEIFGYSPQSNPIANIQKENKIRFVGLSHRDEANISPASVNANTVFIDTDGILNLILNSTKPECKRLLEWSLLTAAQNDTPIETPPNQIATVNNTNSYGNEIMTMVSLLKDERDSSARMISLYEKQVENNNMLIKKLFELQENKSTPPTPSTSGSQDTQQVQQSSVSNSKNNDLSQQGFYILQNQTNPHKYKFFQRQLKSIKSSLNSFQNSDLDYEKIYPNTENPIILNSKEKAIDRVKQFLNFNKIPYQTSKTYLETDINLYKLLVNRKIKF
ncbi:nuclear transcription factor Y subunit alpha-like [Aphidius gifuensis]|uniref:nuclear transcription factor Y subunit alpha-like n=1 Tax=Aphidius gifuensis TaxID=684658 RepID=UPI001CDB6B81|nr:nuclear transcription factor Y subunit alpha-like [Aphidius gifuensis]XP_044011401.1 nuclear transcription factor Y subunit alpha-like [Aphidius gifuensis]